jgi:hypothetical protein
MLAAALLVGVWIGGGTRRTFTVGFVLLALGLAWRC